LVEGGRGVFVSIGLVVEGLAAVATVKGIHTFLDREVNKIRDVA
jgi:hypothetical protein